MNEKSFVSILIALIVLTIAISFGSIIKGDFYSLTSSFVFAAVILLFSIGGKKLAAKALDSDVEHEVLTWSRFGLKPNWHLKKSIPLGIILPLFLTLFSLGTIKCMSILTYETTALKRRVARRFGYYSFTEMTDWHNSVIGAAGIVSVLLLVFISYWLSGAVSFFNGLSAMATYYAFWNILPFSKLDGAQIFFGSRVLWTTLALITLVFTVYAYLPTIGVI
jgi:hypothetical protein